MYDYKVPNNGNNNDWNNIQVEDMARFWELPNSDEFKFFYFEATDLHGEPVDQLTPDHHVFPLPST